MGRSSSSGCLKVVSCGKKSLEDDEFDGVEERKVSSDKRGWSFRKRSPRHRVLINTVPAELPASSINKESSESNVNDFTEGDIHPPVLGKLSVPRNADDVFPLSPVALSSKDAESCDKVQRVSVGDGSPPESVAIVIQTSARGYLAQRELEKVKSVVVLQAAIRGHLVRKQAVGTLRCVQAIIKVQALVRARRVREALKGFAVHETLKDMHKRITKNASILEEEEPGPKPNKESTPSDKMLEIRFARQLLTSLEKTKRIFITCNTEPSSAWSWLERWTSLCAQEQPFSNDPRLLFEHLGFREKNQLISDDMDMETSERTTRSNDVEYLTDNNAKTDAEAAESSLSQFEGDDDLITIDANGFNFHTCGSIDVSVERFTSHDANVEQSDGSSKCSDFSSIRKYSQSIPDQPTLSGSVSENRVRSDPSRVEADTLNNSLNGVVPGKQDNEGRKLAFTSRKSCNPAFAAVQSKFEELSSSLASSRKSPSMIKPDSPVESKLSSVSGPKPDVNVTEVSSSQGATSCSQRFQIGTSECGTEISISSTLDSPERFDEHEASIVEEKSSNNEGFDEHGTVQELKITHSDSKAHSTSNIVSLHKEDNEGLVVSSMASPTVTMHSPKRSKPDLLIKLDTLGEKQVHQPFSQQGSPSSHATFVEYHGTPSSLVLSSGADERKSENKTTRRRISPSMSKGSSPSQNIDSSERDSMEHYLLRDPKRRSSVGSPKPDPSDAENRRNSIPSYMQATESAKAKSLAHSPKSTPDHIHDKDGYPKKKQHLPVANGKQDSPRLPHQAQGGAKGRSGHSPQEREWRR